MTDAEIEALCIEAGLMTRYERGGTVLVFAEDLSRPEMVEGVRKVLELAAQQQAEPGADERAAFEDLLGEYWSLAFSEGQTGISRGDEANLVLHKLRAAQSGQRAGVAEDARDAVRWRFLRQQHEGRDEFLDAEGFAVSEPTAHAFTVFKPGRDVCLEPVGSLPGELDSTIDAAIAAAPTQQQEDN